MFKLFLSPHSDDETLFGAYTLMKERPMVIVFESEDLTKERKQETRDAMKVLGVPVVMFTSLDNLNKFQCCAKPIWIPDPLSKHQFHQEVAKTAMRIFDSKRIIFYSTYRSSRDVEPYGDKEVKATEEMKALKLKALECYKSQIKETPIHFQTKSKDEYYLVHEHSKLNSYHKQL